MNRTDDDLTALAGFRAELAEPGETRLAAIRAKLEYGPKKSRDRTRALVAAAVTLVVIVGVAVGVTARFGGEPASSANHRSAAELLLRLADAAGTGPAPLTVPPGKVLYVRHDETTTGGGIGSSVYELWLDPDGVIPLGVRRTDDGVVAAFSPDPNAPQEERDAFDAEIARQRAELATDGPSLRRATPEFLASLPTDPDALFELLTRELAFAKDWSTEHYVVGLLSEVLFGTEPMIPPQVRAGLYRVLAGLPGITSTGEVWEVAGRQVYAVGASGSGLEYQLLLDAVTGRVVGTHRFDVDRPGNSSTRVWSAAVVDAVGVTP